MLPSSTYTRIQTDHDLIIDVQSSPSRTEMQGHEGGQIGRSTRDSFERDVQTQPGSGNRRFGGAPMLPGQTPNPADTLATSSTDAMRSPNSVRPASATAVNSPSSLASETNTAPKNEIRVDLDPLTQTRLVSPVTGPDGITYSKKSILNHLKHSRGLLPDSLMSASRKDLFANFAMQTRLDLLENVGENHDRSVYLTCPITLEHFKCPVVASDGHTYDYEAIRRVFRNDGISPITREALKPYVYYNKGIGELLKIHNTLPCAIEWPVNQPIDNQSISAQRHSARALPHDQRELEANESYSAFTIARISISTLIGAGLGFTGFLFLSSALGVPAFFGGLFAAYGLVSGASIAFRICLGPED